MIYCKDIYYGDGTPAKLFHVYCANIGNNDVKCIRCGKVSIIRTLLHFLTLGMFYA